MTFAPKSVGNQRQIVVGRNSQIWKSLSRSVFKGNPQFQAISHSEIASFDFNPQDKVWVFSYSRNPKENDSLFMQLANARLKTVFYITSATTNVLEVTRCYEYPRIKRQAQDSAVRILNAQIVSIGVFYDQESSLPPGLTAATSASQLASFMERPVLNSSGDHVRLFSLIHRPFKTNFDKLLHALYGKAITVCGAYPCIMRPVDYLLRLFGVRWYGYLYVSNQLWCTTI